MLPSPCNFLLCAIYFEALAFYQRPDLLHYTQGWLRLLRQISLQDKWICLDG
jgi:hypothetical protein